MSAEYINDYAIGFLYDDWSAIDQKLTGKSHTDDSSAVETFAETIQATINLLNDGGVIFGIRHSGASLSDESVCFALDEFQGEQVTQKLEALKKRLASVGFPPEDAPIVAIIREYCG